MKITASVSSQVFDELLTTVELIGVDRTIKTLKEAKSNHLILDDLDVDFILKCVSEICGVTKERVLYGTDKSDERKISLALAIYFIKTEFSYSYSELKKIFDKDASGLSKYNSLVESLPENPKTDFDKKMDTYIKKIKLLITERKLKK